MNLRTALFLNRCLSFRSLAFGLFLSRILKYFIFGIYGFDRQWTVTPTFGHHLKFIWGFCVHPYLWFVILGFFLDRLIGPLFFRKETAELEQIIS